MIELKFVVTSVNSQLKMTQIGETKKGKPIFSPVEYKEIILTLMTKNPSEYEFFELGKEYSVRIDKLDSAA